MSLDDKISIEDNQRNQKLDQSQSYHQQEHCTVVEETNINEEHSTTTSSAINSSSTVTSEFGLLSPPASPLGPVTANPPMTSTPLITSGTAATSSNNNHHDKTLSSQDHYQQNSSKTIEEITIVSNRHSSSSTSETSSKSSVIQNTKLIQEVGPIQNTTKIQLNKNHEEEESIHHHQQNAVISESSSSCKKDNNVAINNNHSSDSSAITIIQVQSSSSNSENSERIQKQKIQETNLDTNNFDIDIDGLGITRIKVGGTGDRDRSPTPNETSQVVKVTVLNGNSNELVHSTTTTEMDESNSRGPVRFDEGLGSSVGGMGSNPSDLNDTVSEMSSVVNNPSVISALPDRYGFIGGEQYTHESEPDPSPEIVRRREMKWLQMIDKWDHFMRKDFKTVRSRCRKGIPRSVRGRAWYYLCGAAFIKKREPNLYFQLLLQEGKPSDIEDIKKDLHRQFPWHEIFAEEGHGKKDLFNVLKAHSILNSDDGYCQAQAPVASILLMHMPAEDAFWCLVAICNKYLKGYYSPGMEQLQLDGDILFGLLKRIAPPVYKHMKKQKIDPVLYMTEWFLCAYTRTLPWSSVLRVWDSFLCEGVKVLFRVGLILLKYTLGRPGVLKQCPSMYETLSMLKNLPNYVTHEQFLVAQIQRMDVSEDNMRREHYKQSTKRKKAKQKLEAAKAKQQKNAGLVEGSGTGSRRNPTYRSHETSL